MMKVNQRTITRSLLILVIYSILLLGGYFVIDFFNKQDYSRSLSMVEKHLGDSLQISRNRLGQEISQRITLELSYKELQNTTSHELEGLRRLVDKQTKSLQILKNKTQSTTKASTRIDTFNNTSFPTYSGVFESDWLCWEVVANQDTIINDITVFNEFVIQDRYRRKNIFHPYILTTEVTNKNPHTYTSSLTSFSRKVKGDRWVFGPQVGVGVTSQGFGGYVGIGVTYKIFGF